MALAPAATVQAAVATAVVGQAVTFSVTASGTQPFTYQWYKDGTNLSGATGATYSINAVQTTDAGSYSVVVANAAGSTPSDVATLTVDAPPVFTVQPIGQTLNQGAAVTLTVTATGLPAPTYQWFLNGASIAGATNATYTIASAAATDAGTYTVVASNPAGSVTSAAAIVTVNVPPAFTTQPASQSVVTGASVIFSAAASGSPTPTYQWQKNGVNVLNATGASYSIASAATGDAGTYTVIATNVAGSVTSNAAVLTVTPPLVAPTFTAQPSSQTVTAGSAVTFSAAASGYPAPTYQWQKNGVNLLNATGTSFTIASAAATDAGTYTVVATNAAGTATSAATILTVNVPPAFTSQPASQTVRAGATVTFTASATGSPTPTYQWLKGGVAIAGATGASYSIASAVSTDAGTYTVVATNAAGSATSNSATLTVNVAPAFTTQPVNQTVTSGNSVTFTAAASGSPVPSYQWQKNGSAIPGATSGSFTIASAATSDAATYSVVATNAAGSATSSNATLNVATTTAGANLQTIFVDVLGRPPTTSETATYTSVLNSGGTLTDILDVLLNTAEYTGRDIEPVIRLYYAGLARCPDYLGLLNWLNELHDGSVSLKGVADGIVNSTEFVSLNGTLTNDQYVRLLYHNALQREPDVAGLANWTACLDNGASRGAVLLGFSESDEFKALIGWQVEVVRMYFLLCQRMPASNELPLWVGFLKGYDQTNALYSQGYPAGLSDPEYIALAYRGFLRRDVDSAGFNYFSALLGAGTISRPELVEELLSSGELNAFVAPVMRLYFGALQRLPDTNGLDAWVNSLRSGLITLPDVATCFLTSQEFCTRNGTLSDDQFVTLLYRNVLGRDPDPDGFTFWMGVLNSGTSRGAVLLSFTESPEGVARYGVAIRTTLHYLTFLNAYPTQNDLDFWQHYLDTLSDQFRHELLVQQGLGS